MGVDGLIPHGARELGERLQLSPCALIAALTVMYIVLGAASTAFP
jgi:hypothetical protein